MVQFPRGRAHAIDLQMFLRQIVESPAVFSAHSSRALIAGGLVAEAPDLVRRSARGFTLLLFSPVRHLGRIACEIVFRAAIG